jgi:hypothetical protein
MCGIFGYVSSDIIQKKDFNELVRHSQQRGRDSSGVVFYDQGRYLIQRADYNITKLLSEVNVYRSNVAFGHSRLITNGCSDNQPVVRGNVLVLHNGIVVNHEDLWQKIVKKRRLEIDTEIIAGITERELEAGTELSRIPGKIMELCEGVVACALALPSFGKILLFSNDGSLYVGRKGSNILFASERYPLKVIGCTNIEQIRDAIQIDIPKSNELSLTDHSVRKNNIVPGLLLHSADEKLLNYEMPHLRRCTKCLLPETMPFISFDSEGVCNYCRNYVPRNVPKDKEELFHLVEPYRKPGEENDCIVPFSGGRDSSYTLHLVVNELKMKPIAYTYDWGMVTDLGRRNISRICAKLGVENIIVAADIQKKRRYIAMNLKAWLKSPNLGMVSILTAGDKQFFRYVERIKEQTGIKLDLWGINPLEVTYFKSGFLGVPPDFEEKRVYSHGARKQLRYQYLRFRAMLESPGYFNRSLWDTLSGEYYRSFAKKHDYFHVFDYWKWDEKVIEDTLSYYNWEKAPDTKTTWRIGDGTAAFYNYIYYTVAGFTEHDTFRSNQIREGDLTRDEALELVNSENAPRYANIKWYLDTIGFDFKPVIERINSIPKLYKR